MSNQTKRIFIVVGLSLAVVLHLSIKQNPLEGLTAPELTYTVCQGARISDRYTEDQCGQVQDQTRFRYICEQRNKETSNNCWVEKVSNYVEEI